MRARVNERSSESSYFVLQFRDVITLIEALFVLAILNLRADGIQMIMAVHVTLRYLL